MRHRQLFTSTRGGQLTDRFDQVLTSGYAGDGGMFMPDLRHLPALPWRDWLDRSYPEIVEEILAAYIDPQEISREVLHDLISRTYTEANFTAEPVGLRALSDGICMLELHRGPTWAFKDYPLMLIGQLLDYILQRDSRQLTALVFTSGDTGSAAIEAVRGKKQLRILCFFPANGRITAIQQRMMTTVADSNVTVIGVDGNSDELDVMSRGLFGDPQLVDQYSLSSLNSVNLVRILIQTAHWFYGYLRTTEDPTLTQLLTVVVPTGGAGNLASGLLARQMGLPVKVCCSQGPNDSLTQFLQTGLLRPGPTQLSVAPAIDIQNSYNLERVIYLLSNGDCQFVKTTMDRLESDGQVQLDDDFMTKLRDCVAAISVDDAEILAAMQHCYRVNGQLICPHTATAYAAARQLLPESRLLCLATASPLKFPEAVQLAGLPVPADKRTEELLSRPERFVKWDRLAKLKDTLEHWELLSRELIRGINTD